MAGFVYLPSFLCICVVYVYVVFACVLMLMHMYVETRGQLWAASYLFLTLFFESGFLAEPGAYWLAGYLANTGDSGTEYALRTQFFPGSSCMCNQYLGKPAPRHLTFFKLYFISFNAFEYILLICFIKCFLSLTRFIHNLPPPQWPAFYCGLECIHIVFMTIILLQNFPIIPNWSSTQ